MSLCIRYKLLKIKTASSVMLETGAAETELVIAVAEKGVKAGYGRIGPGVKAGSETGNRINMENAGPGIIIISVY